MNGINPLMLVAAFGGGAFGAAIGGVPAFILTGIFAIAGACMGFAGLDAAGFVTGHLAFGSFFGPHLSFAAAAAAAAYAKKAGKLENGADIVTPLSSLNDPMTLVVGGIFGVVGYLFKELLVANLFNGTISPRLVTDNPGFTVFCLGIAARLIFGGQLRTGTAVKSEGAAWTNCLVIGATYSLMVGGMFAGLVTLFPDFEAAIMGNYAVLVFGIAAVGLVWATMGLPFYGCHHITIMSANAAVGCYAHTHNAWAAVIAAVVIGVLAAIINDVETAMINSGTDSHIDGPATAIFILTFVVHAIWP